MAPSLPPTSRWSLDYTNSPSKSTVKVLDPPGFVPELSNKAASKQNATALIPAKDLTSLRQQKAWELALAPAKNVPMQAFMMYMTGGGVQIFSVMSVWFLLKQAVAGIFSVEKVFTPFESKSNVTPTPSSRTVPAPKPVVASFLPQKLVYVLCQIALLAVGLWKCNNMGLLPTHSSDWLAFRERPVWENVWEFPGKGGIVVL